MSDDLTPDVFTADYTGKPGQRAFFLQGRAGAVSRTVRIEKGQVQVLAEKLHEMLITIDPADTISGAAPARDPALASEPEEPEWRAGSIALGYDEDTDAFLLIVDEVASDEEPAPDIASVRFSLRRDQVRSFVLHALAVIEEGRPLCRLCGLPMDPEGHICPASNGHHATL